MILCFLRSLLSTSAIRGARSILTFKTPLTAFASTGECRVSTKPWTWNSFPSQTIVKSVVLQSPAAL